MFEWKYICGDIYIYIPIPGCCQISPIQILSKAIIFNDIRNIIKLTLYDLCERISSIFRFYNEKLSWKIFL